MRVWLVFGVLALMLGLTLGLRTRGGWKANNREVLEISCDRRSAEHCTDLGLDLLEGYHGPVDVERGLRELERGCDLGSGRGCYWRGAEALQKEVTGAQAIAFTSFERGCRLRHFDACAQLGWMKRHAPKAERDLAGGVTDLTDACGNGSALGCTLLGEIVLDRASPTASERLASARSYERGCELGNDRGCLRSAQALACGRGGKTNLAKALGLVRALCEGGDDDACEQRLTLEPADGGLVVTNAALERAVLRAAFRTAQVDDQEGALRAVATLDGGVGTLARASVAIKFDQLDAAEALLGQLNPDPGHPEVEVARQTLAVRREGRPWPEAAWLGWARAGRPDLRHAQWLPTVRDVGDRGACNPSRPLASLRTSDDFMRAVALSPTPSQLDAPFDPLVTTAAFRFSSGSDLPTRLLALAVLARVAKDESKGVVREFEAAARAALLAEHHDTLFFGLLATPSDLRTAAASEAEVVALERALTLPTNLPRREVFDAFGRALGKDARAQQAAFFATVFVILDLFDLLEVPGWLERGGQPAERRARILRRLGEAIAGSGWLVHAYWGLHLQRASNRVVPDPALTEQIAKLQLRLEGVRTGSRGVQALGEWPWVPQGRADEIIEDELGELERLKALSEASP